MKRMNKRGQAWVETVIYTLIGLSIIGIVLGVATPKIKEMTDKALLEQTLSGLSEMHQKVIAVQTATGSSRLADFRIKKGKLIIDADGNTITFVLEETGLKYSQPGVPVPQGGLTILTEEISEDEYDVSLILNYTGSFDLSLNGEGGSKELTQAPIPYQILIKNQGLGSLDITLV